MKVLQVSTPRTWRGGEQQAAYLAKAFSELKIEQGMLCAEDSRLFHELSASGIPLHTFHRNGPSGIFPAAKIRSLCKREGYDLIHAHDSHAHSAAVLAAVLFGNQVPVVVSRRVDFAVSKSIFSRFKYNHHAVRKIICVSKLIEEITAPSIKDTSRLCVVYDGVDTARMQVPVDRTALRRELGIPIHARLVGNVSALADHKDHLTFVRTAAALLKEDPSLHFVIAGTGPEEPAIRALIGELKISGQVHLLGFRTDVPTVIGSMDVFLMTSSTEGLGSVVLDAFAAGTPVVATMAGGIPEVVQHEKTGLLAPVRDSASLAKAVQQILNDASLRDSITTNARKFVQGFTFLETARQTLAIYRDVLTAR